MLAEAIEGAMADDAIRALVLTGAGGTFCSGGDISTMKRQGYAFGAGRRSRWPATAW